MNHTLKKHMPDFNWVKERAECSLGLVFAKLTAEIQDDVEKRNQAPQEARPVKFATGSISGNHIVVVKEGRFNKGVTFRLTQDCIEVLDDAERPMFEATLTLNDDGECRFKIGGQEVESWQLRKKALEDLFFKETRRE